MSLVRVLETRASDGRAEKSQGAIFHRRERFSKFRLAVRSVPLEELQLRGPAESGGSESDCAMVKENVALDR